MNVRHLVTKDFKSLTQATSLLIDGAPYTLTKMSSISRKPVLNGTFEKAQEDCSSAIDNQKGTLRTLFKALPDLENDTELRNKLMETTTRVFSGYEIDMSKPYAPYIPLVVATNTIPPQVQNDTNRVIFNPNGSVTIGEFLDSLNALSEGANSTEGRQMSIDNVSDETDYFNNGYRSCLSGYSSPFFNLYKREELIRPITRLEVAYILVLCWSEFRKIYDTPVQSENWDLGIRVNWEKPKSWLSHYTDGFRYDISALLLNVEESVYSLNVQDFLKGQTVTEYLTGIQNGDMPIAMPLFMSLVELGELGFLPMQGDKFLHPLYEITRGEWVYIISSLANKASKED